MTRTALSMLCACLSFTAACVEQPYAEQERDDDMLNTYEANAAVDMTEASELSRTEQALAHPTVEVPLQAPPAEQQNPTNQLLGPCPADGRVAFSATGGGHVSQAGPVVLGYNDNLFTSVGGGWVTTLNGTTFTAPCTGLYSFSVSFVKDAYYFGGSTDDVYQVIMKNGTQSMGFAWSGESSAQRSTGAYTVTMMLNRGDTVHTTADSDGGSKRHLSRYNFSGFFIR